MAQGKDPLLLLFEDLGGWRVEGASAVIGQGVFSVLPIASDPQPEGRTREAAAAAGETGIRGLFKQLDPFKALCDFMIH